MLDTTEVSSRRPGDPKGPRLRYLIARREGTRLELLTLAETLPVFADAEAARDYLRRVGGDWRVRESTAGELVSLLMGHLPRVEKVALWPVFGVPAGDAQPPTTTKREFMTVLMDERFAASPG